MTRGFTLLELVVALLLTSMVALLASALLSGVLGGAAAVRRAAPSVTGPVLGRVWALEACRTLEVGTGPGMGFEGTGADTRFHARLPSRAGMVEGQQVRFAVRSEGIQLMVGGMVFPVVDSADARQIDYLVDAAGDGAWVAGWSSPVSAPMAIRFRWRRMGIADTLICPIGARG